MKRCPQCRRDYYDDSLLYCLEDGSALIQGSVSSPDEPATAILNAATPASEAATRPQLHITDGDPENISDDATERPNLSADRVAKAGIFDKRILLAVFALAVCGLGGFFGYKYFASPDPKVKSIAVLPFENRSGSVDADYLSDGLADSLIYRLSQLPDLKVVPTSSVMRYRGKEADVGRIASELSVDAVMSGRLVQLGDDLSISVQLIDARNDRLIWAEQYDRKMSDLLATQREIASSIADRLQLKLTGSDARGITKKYTNSNEAYQLWLKGRFYASKRTAKDAQKAIESYQAAVNLDPNFALAYAGLAEANWFLAYYSYPQVNDLVTKARELARKSLELDNTLAEPHSVLGVICFNFDRDFPCMEREQRLAIELNPNYSEGYRRLGLLLHNQGRFDEGRAATKRAIEIDPLSPVANFQLAQLCVWERKYDECEAISQKNIELDPNFWYAHLNLYYVHRLRLDYAPAVEELAKAQEARGEADAAKLIRESFADGNWQTFLKKITDARSRLKFYPYFVATLFAGMGEKEKAFAALNEALDSKDQHVAWAKVDPTLDPIRDDPRFKDVLRRAGFPEQ